MPHWSWPGSILRFYFKATFGCRTLVKANLSSYRKIPPRNNSSDTFLFWKNKNKSLGIPSSIFENFSFFLLFGISRIFESHGIFWYGIGIFFVGWEILQKPALIKSHFICSILLKINNLHGWFHWFSSTNDRRLCAAKASFSILLSARISPCDWTS